MKEIGKTQWTMKKSALRIVQRNKTAFKMDLLNHGDLEEINTDDVAGTVIVPAGKDG